MCMCVGVRGGWGGGGLGYCIIRGSWNMPLLYWHVVAGRSVRFIVPLYMIQYPPNSIVIIHTVCKALHSKCELKMHNYLTLYPILHSCSIWYLHLSVSVFRTTASADSLWYS